MKNSIHRPHNHGRQLYNRQSKKGIRRLWNYLQGIFVAMVLLISIGVASWGWQYAHNSKVLPFRHVNFTGQLHQVNMLKLQQTVQQHLQGGFFVLDLTAMRHALQELPWVEQVAIRRIWPDTLQIQVIEQRPIARWGKKALLNSRGQLFIPPSASIPPNLPQLYAPRKHRQQVFNYFQQLQYQLAMIHLTISELHVDDRQSWDFRLSNGINILLGEDNILRRCQRLVHLYPRIIRAQAADVDFIDLRYTNGLAIKWKSQQKPSS